MLTKRCTDCGEEKTLDQFSNFKEGRFRKKAHCKDCGARQTREWSAKNPEKKKATDAAYGLKNRLKLRAKRAANREAHLAYMREYHLKNWSPEVASSAAERARAFRAANPALTNAWSASRKARKLRATPSWANKEAIYAFYKEAARLTKLTGIEHHVDHIYPLKSKWMCGLHVETNLQILTKTENLRKSNRVPHDTGYTTSTSTTSIVAESANS